MMFVISLALLLASRCDCIPAPSTLETRWGGMEIRDEQVLKVHSAQGFIVNGPNDEPEPGVLVELLDSAEVRESAVITRDDGCFDFPKLKRGKRILRISKQGYDTHYYILEISPSNRKSKVVHLPIRPSS